MTAGLNFKSLPPWAWALAIVGGAIVGFVLLKPGRPGAGETDGESSSGAGGESARSGETAVVQPLTDDHLSALGLTPGDFLGASYSGGQSGESAGESSGEQTFSLSGDVMTLPTAPAPTWGGVPGGGLPAGGDYGGYVPGSGQITSYASGPSYQPGSSTPLPAGTKPTGGQVLAQ